LRALGARPLPTSLLSLPSIHPPPSFSSQVFLHYITSTANDAAREGKRQTISPADIIGALGDAGFEELAAAAAAGAAAGVAATTRRSASPAAAQGADAGAGPPAQKRGRLTTSPPAEETAAIEAA